MTDHSTTQATRALHARVRQALSTSLVMAVVIGAGVLPFAVGALPVSAQTARITDEGTAPKIVPNPVEVLSSRIGSAHRVALHAAKTLGDYASENGATLDHSYLSAQSDAMGHSLQAAIAASVELASVVKRSRERQRVTNLRARNEAARAAHEKLVSKLSGATVVVSEIDAIVREVSANVEAAERELASLCTSMGLQCAQAATPEPPAATATTSPATSAPSPPDATR